MNPRAEIDLSVVIVNWNTRDLLSQCIQSALQGMDRLSFEVIVVDNASSDGSTQLLHERFPGVSVIANQTNVGFACANNQAIAVSRGRYILLLNSDAIVHASAPALMVEFMDSHPEAAVVGAKLFNPDGSFQASYGDFPGIFSELALSAGIDRLIFGKDFPSHSAAESIEIRNVDWVGGACLAARRSAVESVGPLDESYFMYSEEMDWCFRFRQHGWQVFFLPAAQATHRKGQSSVQADEQRAIWLHEGRMRFYARHHNGSAARFLSLSCRIIAVVKAVVWFCVAAFSGRRRESAKRKSRANWRMATYSKPGLT